MTPPGSDRPTIPPAFDVEQYAKDSDARLAKARAVQPDPGASEADTPEAPPSGTRMLARHKSGAVLGDEAWLQAVTGVPYVAVTPDRLKLLPLDHRAGFLLSLMDGATDVETVLELSPLPRGEAVRVIRDLFESGVIDFK